MSDRTTGDRSPSGIVSDAAEAIQLAEDFLNRAVDASHGYDPAIVKQIRIELPSLDAFLTETTRIRTIADDALFVKATQTLRSQIPALQAVGEDLKRIASDTRTPPGVGGYIEQTVTLITQAVALIRELP